jgi:predicted nucleotidyltransferase
MATPVVTFRIPDEVRPGLRKLVAAVKKSPDLLDRLLAVIGEEGSGSTHGEFGLFRNDTAVRAFMVGRLVAAVHPEMIWLFGSRARGDGRPDSDYDLLVVLPDDEMAEGDPYLRVREPLTGVGLAVDAVPCSLSEFEGSVDQAGTLVHAANREGVLLYESPARRRKHRHAA